MSEWESWEQTIDNGPWAIFKRSAVFLFFASCLVCGLSWAFGWFSQTAGVVQDELGPRTVLRRYEWFKDAAATLDARQATIKVYDRRFDDLVKSYDGKKRHEWTRTDQEQWNVWSQELAGIKASYNALASEYNAAMAKINYKFTNVGDVPAGGQPLPKEFRPYEEK